nr:hypothetical protein [Candidatus Anoxychlamydiales bacterium]
MASSITFSSVTSSIKDKCAHLVD